MLEYIIIVICLIGCGYNAFQLGLRSGAERTLTKLREERIITFDKFGTIKPNPFYIPKEDIDN